MPLRHQNLLLTIALALAPALMASDTTKSKDSGWTFSLLPKSLQKDPTIEVTVMSELTEEGRKLPPPSREKPAYYLAKPSGYVKSGDGPDSGKMVLPAELERLLEKSLQQNGYVPSPSVDHPPTLLIMYVWGVHTLVNRDNEAVSKEQIARNYLDRAALVGGPKFAETLKDLLKQASDQATANPAAREDPSGEVAPVEPTLGQTQRSFNNPIELFKMRSRKNAFLVEQAADDVYFVVASAYDFARIAKGEQKLLWRTRMTVNTRGVSEQDTIPAVVASAAPYFGKDMSEPEVIVRKTVRNGRAEIGEAEVIGIAPPSK